MGAFGKRMKETAYNLISKYGSHGTMSYTVYTGEYDPRTGEMEEVHHTLSSVPYISVRKASALPPGIALGNINLDGFSESTVMIPALPSLGEVDTTYTFNGQNIVNVEPLIVNDETVLYYLDVGEK